VSATSFFLALGVSKTAGGVRVQSLPLVTDTPPSLPIQPHPLGKRRRLSPSAGLPAASLPATAGADGTFCVGGADRGRRRVAWQYQGGRRAGRAQGAGRAQRLSVAVHPARVVLPSRATGDVRRVFQLLAGGRNVFLTGPPGCRKTHLFNNAVDKLRDAGLVVAACASTGVAASLVGGTTVHSWVGSCNGDADIASPLQMVLKDVIPFAAKVRMCAAMVLVIDEVVALSLDLITRLDEVLRAVRQLSSPFDWLTMLAAGDVLQLSPPRGSFAFLSDSWRAAFGYRAVVLETHWRHGKDAELLGLLLRLRKGRHTAVDMELLATRRTAVAQPGVFCLLPHKADADAKNDEELHSLSGESVEFISVDEARAKYLTLVQATTLLNSAVKLLRRLTLRVGAAMAVPTGCLAGQGVPCGTRGFVTCFRTVGDRHYPRVRFQLPSGGNKSIDVIPAIAHAVALYGVNRAATRSQLPLVLAWAATIHAAQGWTLQEAAVDLTSAFAAGKALSGLSRTPTLDCLHLIGFDEDKIIVDGMGLAVHESLVAYK